jgi:hypothetical protein
MIREYEIFEVLPNGSALRVTAVSGLEFAQLTLQGLAKHTSNECFAADAKRAKLSDSFRQFLCAGLEFLARIGEWIMRSSV